jgi:HAD superfamily phosphatase (TIGR01668 family)
MIGWLLTALLFSGIILVTVKSVAFVTGSKPWLRVPNISSIDASHLKLMGIKGIVFDVDFTLTAYHEDEIHPLVSGAFSALAEEFKVTIFTNTVSEERYRRVQQLFPNIPVVGHQHHKPGKAGFLEAATILGLHPREIAMVGDRFATDIFGGNQAGMKTILVSEPRSGGGDPAWYPVLRWFEHTILD